MTISLMSACTASITVPGNTSTVPKERISRSNLFFRRLSRECGFFVSSHRFRHTLATKLMAAPERNLHMVKSILGHRSVATTMEYIDFFRWKLLLRHWRLNSVYPRMRRQKKTD
ncbi:site-specific integrase [Escherichia coli]